MNPLMVMIFVAVALAALSASVLLDRLLNPWMAKRSVAKLLADVRAGCVPKKTNFDHEILFSEGGFSVVNLKKADATPLSMNWSEVCKAAAFKRDLFSVDLVCLFLSRHDGSGLELDEDMKAWKEFIAALPSFLPTCRDPEQWFREVAFPAFATNAIEIFSRQELQPDNLAPVT
jgi:hypothetical protein